MSKSLQAILFVIICLITFQKAYTQLSKKHYLPPITSDDPIENQYIYISTPKNKNVGFKIIPIGKPSSEEITGIVSNTNPFTTTSFSVGQQLFQPSSQTSTIIADKGYIIEADDVVYVSVRMRSVNTFQAAAIVSKGNSALGTDFRMGGFANNNPGGGHLNFVSVMATEDDTKVTFDDFTAGISINNYSGPLPFTRTLNENESFIVSVSTDAGGDPNDLIGTLIKSDKPVVVNSGSATSSFHTANGRDYGMDQIVDASKIGTEYIFVKGDGRNEWENVLIVAHEDDTEISTNGGGVIASINKGKWFVIEGNAYNADGNLYVQTSKPAFAYQGVGFGNSAANQGLFFVPPLSCENRGKVDNISAIEKIGNDNFDGGITIVTNTGATVTVNNQPINSFDTSGPNTVDGNPNYVTYKVTNLTGNVSVQSSEELYCAYFNRNGAATSGSFYSGFPSSPEINFDTTVTSLGSCIPNVTLQAANTDLFDSFKWEYFDENTSTWVEKSTNEAYKPLSSEPGKYRLIGKIDCTNTTFESIEIPVSICPDDFDGDLIIDNLDVDIDNDGILNCDESIGNATVNIADINNPAIIFQDASTDNSIISSVFSKTVTTNSFTGTNNGNFTSTVNAASASNLKYELNFTQNINFTFTQSDLGNHTISETEIFILKIGPNSKNITLLDPDNQLLVDSNFDGEFEADITNISASEIHFKFKENLLGSATTFKFVANQVNQMSFEHQTAGTTTPSIFKGNIQLTCFSLDSDGDGIENMFDLDSDNDGIPDINEAFPQPSSISGVDTNQDGLDDVFTTILNVDSDSDGVLNYIDLDSDNDGIFDATEAGHNLDTDFDGVIDNANALVGINGLVDALETSPDAKVLSLNYMVANTDNDTDFNFVELDADNDGCFDVTEAGFTDLNNNGTLGNNPIQIDANGKVINTTDGYTNPNINYITSAPIILNTPFLDVTFCENDTNSITIDSTAETFQWQISTDGTTWSSINNDAIYNGVTTSSLQITNTPLSFNNYQYRVLQSRVGNSCKEQPSNAITLSVNPLPIVTNVDLLQCDDDLDRISTVNLTEAEISISTNYLNETFTYFETEAHAIAGTPEVADKFRYPVNQNGEAWVRTISDKTCYQISKINVEVEAAADVAYNKEFSAVCDDFLQADGTSGTANNDTDGITNFDFSEANAEILAFFPPVLQPDLEVSYFETREDRTAVLNQITDIANYRNIKYPSNITRQTIYFKITNKNNNNCSGTGELYLKTNPVPTANPVADLQLCDNVIDGDSSNGIVQKFNLESQTSTILGTQNDTDFTVTYHLSSNDANTGDNPQSSPFENTIRDSQPIFVRVTNNATGCFTDHTSFNVLVNPTPIANSVNNLEVCDDNSDGSARNGFSQKIDLTSQTDAILGTQDAIINKVTYHRSLAEATSGDNPLVSPYTNLIPNRETIFVRVFNENTQCANVGLSFDVIINPEPIFTPPTNLAYCDDDLDDDDSNGIIQNINLDSKIAEILGTTQNPDDYNVTFHISQADATNGNKPISSPYENVNATETIFVRIQNKTTFCVNDDATFELIVNPLPDFTVTTPKILCLNNAPLNISVENAKDIYSYEWQDENGNTLGTNDNLDVGKGGSYKVIATTTNGTFCSREEIIVVNESNVATLESSFITISDEGNNVGNDNLSIAIDTINNNLGPGNYQFAILNTDNNERFPFAGFQDEPLFENLEGGIYQIIVNDKNGCVPDTTLLVSVIQFPKFFTPNDDGKNDTWVIKGANKTFYPNASINIFNRFGKIVGQFPIDSEGWNGMYQGKLLPSNDYWYNVTLIPADNTKPTINKKGNFSLLRKQ